MKPMEKKQTSSKECLEVFSATAGTLFFSLTRLGPMRSQWSTLYHPQLGQKAMKTTWLKIPKCSLGLQTHPATSVSFWPPPKKLILKKKSWQLGRGNCFQIPESKSPLKLEKVCDGFFFCEIITRYVFFCCEVGHWLWSILPIVFSGVKNPCCRYWERTPELFQKAEIFGKP